MQQSQGGSTDNQILAELFRVHRRVVLLWLISQLNDYALAEDILQDAYIAIFRSRNLKRIRRPLQYLFRVVRRLLFQRLKLSREEAAKVVFDPEVLEAALQQPGVATLSCPYQQAFVNDLSDLIDRLPARRRNVMLLSIAGHDYAVIAEKLNMSETAVGQQLVKARRTLEKALALAKQGTRTRKGKQ